MDFCFQIEFLYPYSAQQCQPMLHWKPETGLACVLLNRKSESDYPEFIESDYYKELYFCSYPEAKFSKDKAWTCTFIIGEMK